jgi:hypothetical protein
LAQQRDITRSIGFVAASSPSWVAFVAIVVNTEPRADAFQQTGCVRVSS